MSLKLVITFSLMWFRESYSIESTPVLTWTLDSLYYLPGDVSSLRILQPNKFEAILTSLIHQQFKLLVFVEEFLDVEDFSAKDVNGKSLFLHTEKIYGNHTTMYFPLVHKPSTALKEVSKKYLTQEFFIVSLVNNEWKNVIVNKVAESDTNVIIAYLENGAAPQSRTRFLQNHDIFINEVCNAVLHNKNVMCMYVGFNPFKVAEMTAERLWELKSHMRRSRRSVDEASMQDVLSKALGMNFSSADDPKMSANNVNIDLASFDTPLHRPEIEVEGHKGNCDHDCTFEAESPDAAVSVHLATAPTLWYGNQEITLKDFETSMIIFNDSKVTLKVETPDATLHFHFRVLPDNNWVMTGVNLIMKNNGKIGEDQFREDREAIPEEIFLSSDIPIVGRQRRQFHCQLNSFSGQSNTSRAALLYLYKMTINLRHIPDNAQWFWENLRANETGNMTGVDYCIPFASAAMLNAFFIVSTMVVLAMAAIAMLMSAKPNQTWDTQAQKVLLREA